MADGSSIGLPQNKEAVDTETLACKPASVLEGNRQPTQAVEKTLPEYLDKWRLTLLTIAFVKIPLDTSNKLTLPRLCVSVFLSALDITIVSTSLVAITNDLKAFDKSSWIISSYLVTYFSDSRDFGTALLSIC